MKVYIVYYTDRYDGNDKVIAVFTQEELAKKALLLCPNSTHYNSYYYKEEHTDVTLNVPENCRPYRVLVREGNVIEVGVIRFLENFSLYAPIMGTVDSMSYDLTVYCWATDADHASQLALEMALTALKDKPRT